MVYPSDSYSSLIRLTLAHEPEKRPDLYTKAVECFEKAIQVYPQSFDGHYHLAYQLAEMREVTKAILAVKQSLSLESAHVPSWHLLALLLSAQKEFDRALSICAVGLKESEWDLPQTDGLTASQLDGEEYLALRITQAALHDKIHGAESALEPQEALFALYTKVFAPEPASVGDSLYDIQNIRRRDQSDIELGSSATIVGRPRAGSILSVRSRSGASDIGHGLAAHNGSNLGMYMMASLLLLAILCLVCIAHSSNSLFVLPSYKSIVFVAFQKSPNPTMPLLLPRLDHRDQKRTRSLFLQLLPLPMLAVLLWASLYWCLPPPSCDPLPSLFSAWPVPIRSWPAFGSSPHPLSVVLTGWRRLSKLLKRLNVLMLPTQMSGTR